MQPPKVTPSQLLLFVIVLLCIVNNFVAAFTYVKRYGQKGSFDELPYENDGYFPKQNHGRCLEPDDLDDGDGDDGHHGEIEIIEQLKDIKSPNDCKKKRVYLEEAFEHRIPVPQICCKEKKKKRYCKTLPPRPRPTGWPGPDLPGPTLPPRLPGPGPRPPKPKPQPPRPKPQPWPELDPNPYDIDIEPDRGLRPPRPRPRPRKPKPRPPKHKPIMPPLPDVVVDDGEHREYEE